MKSLVTTCFFCAFWLSLVAQVNKSAAEKIKADIVARLPEGEFTADVLSDVKQLEPQAEQGITEDEYKAWVCYSKDVEMASTGTIDFSIASDGKTIRFFTYDNPSLLDSVTINLDRNIVLWHDTELEYQGEKNITNEANGLHGKWHGYYWSIEKTAEKANHSTSVYLITLGKLEGSGQTFLQIQAWEITDGSHKVWIDFPLLF